MKCKLAFFICSFLLSLPVYAQTLEKMNWS